jgi:hypothetical protein
MPVKYNRRVTYEEFEQRVRRHRPSELVPAIAAITSGMSDDDFRAMKQRLVFPWGLAAAVRESLCRGNEHRRSGVTSQDIMEISGAYNALAEPLLDGSEIGKLHAFMTRISNEQFPYQQSAFEELTRPYAMFYMDTDSVTSELADRKFWERALGCSMEQFWGVGFFAWVAAQENSGWIDLAILQRPDLAPLFDEVPRDTLERVITQHFSTTRSTLCTRVNETRSKESRLRRYDFNPLVRNPLIVWNDGRLLAPIRQLVLRPVSTSGMYFIGLETCATPAERDAFTRDVGELFEAYVGRQLREMHSAEVLPEVRYDGNRSVDWFLVFPDLLVLIEAKSTRLTQEARMGKPRFVDDVERTLGRAFRQLRTTHDLIRSRHPAVAHVPTDRPIFGLVVTLEPYYLTNNPMIRDMLPDPGLPTHTTSIRELEHLVAISTEESIAEFLLDVMTDPERSTWDFFAALGNRSVGARNRILDAAWAAFPWSEAARQRAQESGGDGEIRSSPR